MRPATRILAITLAALATGSTLSACSDTTSGTPPTSASTPASAGSINPALKVPSPLPTDQLLTNPCALLSTAQATTLGIQFPGKLDNRDPIGCNWTSAANPLNSVGIGPSPQNHRGITDIYAGKAKSAYFEPTAVNGYPAVYTGLNEDRSKGFCDLWIGVTDQLAFAVSISLGAGENKTNPCPIAERFGAAVIDHLQGKA